MPTGPTSPIKVSGFAVIQLAENLGVDNQNAIATGPESLPTEYIQRRN